LPVLKRWSSPPIPLNVVYLADRQRPSRVSAFIAFVEQVLPGWLTKAARSRS
jgi:DNA-binding transcriptional LysR family regulator